mgnify:CR=1 FL=1
MRVLLAVAVLMLVAACQAPPAEMTEAEIAQIEAEVMQFADDWMDAWKDMESDCETAEAMLHPDHWVRITGSAEVRDISDWPDFCARSTATRAGFSGDWTETKVRVISPDAAVFIGTYSPTYHRTDDRPPRHYLTSVQRLLVERTDNGWGLSLMTNTNGPYEDLEG